MVSQPSSVAAFRRWVRREIKHLMGISGMLDPPDQPGWSEIDTRFDDTQSVLDQAARYAAQLALPDVFRCCKLRGGGVAPMLGVEILTEALAILDRLPAEGEWLECDEAARYLGLTVKALYQLVHRGRIKPDGRGSRRSYRFRRSTLDAHLCPSSQPKSKAGRKAKYSGFKNSTK